jgi:WD40 repeat protein
VALTPALVLTCAHVIRDAGEITVRLASGVELAFRVSASDPELDAALLEPEEGESRRIGEESIVVPRRLWRGSWPKADGSVRAESFTAEPDAPRETYIAVRVGADPSERRVSFEVLGDRQGISEKHSGGPALAVDPLDRTTHPRTFGIVRSIDRTTRGGGDSAEVGWLVPMDRIAERFEQVAELLETPIERSLTWHNHWEPRSRGVASHEVPGFFHKGYRGAYHGVLQHLEARDGGLLVLTGPRASGKSALLARVVVLSCPRYRTELADRLPDVLDGCRARRDPVDAAVLARNLDGDAVAAELARQLGLTATSADQLVGRMSERHMRPAVVIDAVDESPVPEEVIELAVMLADAGAQVALGLLRGDQSAWVPAEAAQVQLDTPEYHDGDAIRECVEARLTHTGRYDTETARRIAAAVAERADGSFLIAVFAARKIADQQARIDTRQAGWRDALPTDLGEAFRQFIESVSHSRQDRAKALAVLHPLAHARGDGLTLKPSDAWLAAANRLRPDVMVELTEPDLQRVVGEASRILVRSPAGGWHFFHPEGLGEAIRTMRARQAVSTNRDPADQVALDEATRHAAEGFVEALVDLLPRDPAAPADAYDRLDPYLLNHLATHLVDGGRVGEILDRPGLLLAATPDALRRALAGAASSTGWEDEPARIAVVHALARRPADRTERAVALHAALRRQGARRLADRVRAAARIERLPHELLNGPRLPPVATTMPEAHAGSIRALAVLQGEIGPRLISAGDDRALRSWLADGHPGSFAVTDAGAKSVALVVLDSDHGPMVVSGRSDGALRSWLPSGEAGPLQQAGDGHPVLALAVLPSDRGSLIVSAGADRQVRLWPLDGPLEAEWDAEQSILALAVLAGEEGALLVGGGLDGTLRSWLPTGEPALFRKDGAHRGGVRALATSASRDGRLLVSAGGDGVLRGWLPDRCQEPRWEVSAHVGALRALTVVQRAEDPLIVSGGADGALRSWLLGAGAPPAGAGTCCGFDAGPLAVAEAHAGSVTALAALPGARGSLVVSGGDDRALRSWRADVPSSPPAESHGHTDSIRALAVLEDDRGPIVVSGGDDRVLRSCRLDGSGGPIGQPDAHDGAVRALTVLEGERGPVVISAGEDRSLRSWLADGRRGPFAVPDVGTDLVRALAVLRRPEGPLVVSGGADGMLRSWEWPDGRRGFEVRAHTEVTALAVLKHEDGPLLISAGADGALHSWRVGGDPGPHFARPRSESDWISALAVLDGDDGQLVVCAGADGTLHSWFADGRQGPPAVPADGKHPIRALATVDAGPGSLLISAGDDHALRIWPAAGRRGPLEIRDVHTGRINALAVLDSAHGPLLVSAGEDRLVVTTALRVMEAQLAALQLAPSPR